MMISTEVLLNNINSINSAYLFIFCIELIIVMIEYELD